MSCPTSSGIPKAVWTVAERPIEDLDDARIGMIGHIGKRNSVDIQQHFIIVWKGDGDIGAIFPLMCTADGAISIGPDTIDGPAEGNQYNVKKLNIKSHKLYTGISLPQEHLSN